MEESPVLALRGVRGPCMMNHRVYDSAAVEDCVVSGPYEVRVSATGRVAVARCIFDVPGVFQSYDDCVEFKYCVFRQGVIVAGTHVKFTFCKISGTVDALNKQQKMDFQWCDFDHYSDDHDNREYNNCTGLPTTPAAVGSWALTPAPRERPAYVNHSRAK
jgi:hypothetical protein